MKRLACLFVCAAAIASAHAQGTTEAVGNYGPVPGSSLASPGPMDGAIGWTFKPLVDLDVFALGCVAQSLTSGQPQLSVGLWTAGGQLLASNAVTTSSTQINQSRYESITPIHLTAGQTYNIGAYSDSGTVESVTTIVSGHPFLDGSVSVAENYIQWLGAAQSSTLFGFPFPAGVPQSAGTIYLGPNFRFYTPVPEPSTLALVGLGGLALVCWRKRR